ncbi:hypothetical protein ATL17_2146 [Maritalea mobilis]|uniref:Uncharacterized protein n=1 Tax=Maritalea mobilis TaxID=483324 RepID=A0A4R6VPI2_9HYPH|nr:hypothetical protein ATL17_2146 [Maritalea mobilis]
MLCPARCEIGAPSGGGAGEVSAANDGGKKSGGGAGDGRASVRWRHVKMPGGAEDGHVNLPRVIARLDLAIQFTCPLGTYREKKLSACGLVHVKWIPRSSLGMTGGGGYKLCFMQQAHRPTAAREIPALCEQSADFCDVYILFYVARVRATKLWMIFLQEW